MPADICDEHAHAHAHDHTHVADHKACATYMPRHMYTSHVTCLTSIHLPLPRGLYTTDASVRA